MFLRPPSTAPWDGCQHDDYLSLFKVGSIGTPSRSWAPANQKARLLPFYGDPLVFPPPGATSSVPSCVYDHPCAFAEFTHGVDTSHYGPRMRRSVARSSTRALDAHDLTLSEAQFFFLSTGILKLFLRPVNIGTPHERIPFL